MLSDSAKNNNKKILIYVYSDYCGYCKKQISGMNDSSKLKEYFNDNIILFKVNRAFISEDNPYYTSFVPAMFVVDDKGELVTEFYGLSSPYEMLEILKIVED